MDYTDSYNGTIATYIDPRVYNYGPAGYDRRLNLTFNYLWDIPNASKLWNSPVARWGLDHWEISGITSFISGGPAGLGFSTVDGQDITGGGDGARVVLTCNPNAGAPRSFLQWFNTGCVQRPAQGTWGTLRTRRWQVRHQNWDIALFKNIPIKDRLTIADPGRDLQHVQSHAVLGPQYDRPVRRRRQPGEYAVRAGQFRGQPALHAIRL